MISPARFHLFPWQKAGEVVWAPGPVVGKPGLSLQDFVKNVSQGGRGAWRVTDFSVEFKQVG